MDKFGPFLWTTSGFSTDCARARRVPDIAIARRRGGRRHWCLPDPSTESAPVNSRIYDLNNTDPLVILEKIRRTVDVVAWQNERIQREFRSLYLMLSNRTDAIESVAAVTESKVELLNDKFDLLLEILAPGNRLRLELTDSTPPQAASQP